MEQKINPIAMIIAAAKIQGPESIEHSTPMA
jgi:hypothetical protein